MNSVDELVRLERLRHSGGLSDAEFEQVKTRLLAGNASSSVDAKQLALLQKEVELARLDRAWEYEKQTYTIQVRSSRYVPSASEGIFTALIAPCVGGGLIWMWSALGADGLRQISEWLTVFVNHSRVTRVETRAFCTRWEPIAFGQFVDNLRAERPRLENSGPMDFAARWHFFIADGIWSGLQMHNKATRYAARKHVYFEQREEIIRRR